MLARHYPDMIKPYSTLAYRARSNLPTPEHRGIMEFELSTLLLLTLSALGAGFIDAIAGGGGLITLPVLLGHLLFSAPGPY